MNQQKPDSETPETDIRACDGWTGDAVCVGASFARDLERQRNAAHKVLADVVDKWMAALAREDKLAKALERIALSLAGRGNSGFLPNEKGAFGGGKPDWKLAKEALAEHTQAKEAR